MRWSPPEQNAQPPSRGEGPLPVSSTQPTSGVSRAWSSAWYSSSTVCGRNALRTSGRSNAIRTAPVSHRAVIGDVGEREPLHRHPGGRVEQLGDHAPDGKSARRARSRQTILGRVTVRWADPSDDRDIDELMRLRGVMFDGMELSIPDNGWRAEVAGVLRAGLADGSFFAAVVDAPDGEPGLAACGVGMIWIGLPWPGETVGKRGYVQSMATDPRWRRRGYAQAVVQGPARPVRRGRRAAGRAARQLGRRAAVPILRVPGVALPRAGVAGAPGAG